MRFVALRLHIFITVLMLRPLGGQEVRVIEFPDSRDCGVVEVFSSNNPNLFELYNEDSRQFHASGPIRVDTNAFVFLRLGQAEDISFLRTLPDASIQALEVWNRELDGETLGSIAKLEGLRVLRLSQCSFEGEAFDDLEVLPNLEQITVRSADRADRSHVQSLLQWVAKQPKVELLHTSPSVDATDLRYLEGHNSLAWLSIELNKDREAVVLRMLRGFPNLRSLTLMVDADVSPRALDRISDLADLEELSVFSCMIDGPLVEQIAKCSKLSNLRLANFQAGEGFTEALSELKSLRNITVAHGLWEGNGQRMFNQGVTKSLLTLPNLERGLKINELTEEIWKGLLSKAEKWKELRIEGVQPGFRIELLRELPKFKNLETLKLSHVPLKDDELRWLHGLDELRELQLFMTKISGKGFEHLAALPKLRQMLIGMEARVVEPDLVHLRKVPQLRNLQVMGFGFRSDHYGVLAECRSLSKITLQQGVKDDTLAQALSTLPSLKILSFGDSSISDDGLTHLAELTSLQELTGRGVFTVSGIESLSSLKNLSRLYLRSQSLSEADCERLPELFPSVGNLGFQR